MGKLNFKECDMIYDSSLINLDIFDNKIVIKYNFNNFTKDFTTLKIILNTIFIQNLALVFKSKKELYLKLNIRKGEQSFIYRDIGFNIIDSIIIPLEELNPYTSSIDIVILNSHTSGTIIIEKNLE